MVGCIDGRRLGWPLGVHVGSLVGNREGLELGTLVGKPVGRLEGSELGRLVGTLVGGSCWSCSDRTHSPLPDAAVVATCVISRNSKISSSRNKRRRFIELPLYVGLLAFYSSRLLFAVIARLSNRNIPIDGILDLIQRMFFYIH